MAELRAENVRLRAELDNKIVSIAARDRGPCPRGQVTSFMEAADELRAAAGKVGKVELILLGEQEPEWARLIQACRQYDVARRGK